MSEFNTTGTTDATGATAGQPTLEARVTLLEGTVAAMESKLAEAHASGDETRVAKLEADFKGFLERIGWA